MSGRWAGLDPRVRRALIAVGTVDAALRLLALTDLARRPTADVRGPKWRWALVLTLANSAGIAPMSYFLRGRHPAH